MGVLRLTPDAFADSGRSPTRAAVSSGRCMISEGADIVEILCAPHSELPPPEQLVEVVGALAGDVRIAVATGSPELAAAATAAGATLICDHSTAVPASRGAREALIAMATATGAGWVALQAPAPLPAGDANGADPGDSRIVAETLAALRAQADRLSAAGVREIYLDPGIGSGRAPAEDLDLLGGLEQLAAPGWPLVVGTGDGRLIDELHAAADTRRRRHTPHPGDCHADRLEGALVMAVWAMLAGVAVLRTHHVAATVEAARTVGAKHPVGAP